MTNLEFVSELPEGPELRRMQEAIAFYATVAADLRKHPGDWARVKRQFASKSSLKSTATNINRGAMASFPKGEYQAATRNGELYMRYIGGSNA